MKVVGDIFLRSLYVLVSLIKLALITLSGLRKNRLLHVDCKTCDKIDYLSFFDRFERSHLFALQSCNVLNFDE